MNKKIIRITFMLLTLLIVSTIPVMAKPTNGQKIEVALVFKFPPISSTYVLEDWSTGGVIHNTRLQEWNVELREGNADALGDILEVGTAEVVRKTLVVPSAKKVNLIDYYEITFGDGGFEGIGKVMLGGFVAGTWEESLARGLFQGTGEFEGQTLNVGHPWWSKAGIIWEGYWLKP